MLRRVRRWLAPPPAEMTPAEEREAMARTERAVRAVVTDPDVLAHLPEMMRASANMRELAAELHDVLSFEDSEAVARRMEADEATRDSRRPS